MNFSFNKKQSNIFEVSPDTNIPRSWTSWLIGRPLQTADAPHQTIGKLVGLAVFASDALSSTAYATQEILMVLAVAGTSAFYYSVPISFAIVALMWIVTISYEHTIHAYPGGGGAYIVARDNLGDLPAQIAAAALLTDYILTVAVSISSGVAQIASAFPEVYAYRVWLAVGLVGIITLINLRGVRESGSFLAIPTYFFVGMMFLTVSLGIFRYLTGSLGSVVNPPELEATGETLALVTPFLLLHAFANGTAALTGIEAISNGVTAFKEPRSRNAAITLLWMSAILASLFLGISILANVISAIPSEFETVISQISRTVFGGQNLFYFAVIAGTSLILILAANTAFAGFPRLGALCASDGFLPRQLTYRGSRLVYSRGIIALAFIACTLIILFQASVSRLIPLYAIGVFMSFTLSQAGMAKRWLKSGRLKPGEEIKEPGSILKFDNKWLVKMVMNSFGAFCTLIVMFVFGITKFSEGAWIIIFVIPLLVLTFSTIHRHYKKLARQLSLDQLPPEPGIRRNRVLLLISGVHQGTLEALRYARYLSDDITAVHVSIDDDEAAKITAKWEMYGEGYRLAILQSPYRLIIEPLLEYLAYIETQKQEGEVITIIVPYFVDKQKWTGVLHMRTAETLQKVLRNKKNTVIIEVPYQVS
jgi:amino acid transporter